jgi:hypothetical protein
MQQQTSALQKLADLFEKASDKGEISDPSLAVLLEIMKSSCSTDDAIEFFGLLYKVIEELDKINILKPKGSRHAIQKLHDFIVKNNLHKMPLTEFNHYIEVSNIIDILISLAKNYKDENPTIFLESDFLDGLKEQFNSLLNEITDSDLSNNLKIFLTKQIEDILYAIRRYSIDGTEGLEKAIKSFFSDLAIVESHLDKKDKKNPIYKNCQIWLSTLLISLFHPSAYDIISVYPTFRDYFLKTEELVKHTIGEMSLQEVLEKSLDSFNKQPHESLSGKEQKSISPAKTKGEPPLEMKANLED